MAAVVAWAWFTEPHFECGPESFECFDQPEFTMMLVAVVGGFGLFAAMLGAFVRGFFGRRA